MGFVRGGINTPAEEPIEEEIQKREEPLNEEKPANIYDFLRELTDFVNGLEDRIITLEEEVNKIKIETKELYAEARNFLQMNRERIDFTYKWVSGEVEKHNFEDADIIDKVNIIWNAYLNNRKDIADLGKRDG